MPPRPLESVDGFVSALASREPSFEEYQTLLASVRFGYEAVRPYCHFRDEFYTRNLIARGRHFELLALCWAPGQISPIHDHAGSEGWIRSVAGVCEEVWYHLDLDADGVASWTRGRAARVTPGEVSHINDDLAWHTVGNPGDEPAVTLHLYAPPIDECQYIDAETGVVRSRAMSYYSRDGVLVE